MTNEQDAVKEAQELLLELKQDRTSAFCKAVTHIVVTAKTENVIKTLCDEVDRLRLTIREEIHRQCAHCKNGLTWTDDGRAHYGYEHQGVTGIVTCGASRDLRAALQRSVHHA